MEGTSSEITSDVNSDKRSENVHKKFREVSLDKTQYDYMVWDRLDLVSNLLETLGGSALPSGHTDLDKAKEIRHRLISHGKDAFLGDRKTIFINEPSADIYKNLVLLEQLFNNNPVIALDTEYVPCTENNPHLHDLFYIQVGGSNESPIFIIGKKYFLFFQKLFFAWLSKPNSLILGFFLMADLPILSTTFSFSPGCFDHKVFDFFLFFKLLNPQLFNHSLKDWYFRIFGIKLDKSLQKTNWAKVQINFDLLEYMQKDVQVLLDFLGFLPNLEDVSWRNTWSLKATQHDPFITSYILDQVLIPLFVEMNINGVNVDEHDLEKSVSEQKKHLQDISQLLGCKPEQLRSAKKLETHLETIGVSGMVDCLNIWPRTGKSQQISLGTDAIKGFMHNEKHYISDECSGWFVNYIQYKEIYSRLVNSQKLLKCVIDGKIFPSWNIFGAATGRITTSKPALNSTPREHLFRSMFKAPENHQYIVVDYAMIEIVIIAVISNDQQMLENLYQKKDLHMFLASQVLGEPYEKLMELKSTYPQEYKKKRTPMKSVNFGLLYGMGAETLHKRLFYQGHIYTEQEVRHIHAVWTETYPGIAKYKHFCKNQTSRQIAITPGVPQSNSAITSIRGRVPRTADAITSTYNFPIQATCADILKTAIGLFTLLKDQKVVHQDIFIRILAQDEVVFSCPVSMIEETQSRVKNILLAAANNILQPLQPKIKCEVEIGVGNSWADKP